MDALDAQTVAALIEGVRTGQLEDSSSAEPDRSKWSEAFSILCGLMLSTWSGSAEDEKYEIDHKLAGLNERQTEELIRRMAMRI